MNLIPVARIKHPVKIDGDFTEFKDIKPLILNNSDFVFPVDAISSKLWTGPDDLSSKVYLAYDDKNFYFAAEVTDDIMINENTDFRMWQNDSFQLAFDTMNDAALAKLSGASGYDLTDYEFGIALTPKGPQCFCYTAAASNKIAENKKTPFDVVVKPAGKNTMIYELAIPWTALAPLKPEAGKVFKFNFINLDSDQSKQISLYCMGLTQGIWGGKNPDLFKTFILMP